MNRTQTLNRYWGHIPNRLTNFAMLIDWSMNNVNLDLIS